MGSVAITCLLSFLAFQNSTTIERPVRPPDILLMLSDQQTASAVGFLGTPGFYTPAIDRLALDGVVFRNAFCDSPQCSPSRAAILTGRFPHLSGVIANVPPAGETPREGQSPRLSPATLTIAHSLRQVGYETVYFGKWHLGGNPASFGFDRVFTQNFYSHLTQELLEFLDERHSVSEPGERQKRLRPLFLVASWLNPHDIYALFQSTSDMHPAINEVEVPASFMDDLTQKPAPQLEYLLHDQGMGFVNATEQNWRRYLAYYSFLVENVDNEIRQIGGRFRERYPDSMVIFASDHGDYIGAHGLPFKGPALYDEVLRVPLIINWPSRFPAGECHALVTLMDLAPTLCEIGQATPPPDVNGRSLVPLLIANDRTSVPFREFVVSQYYGKGRWRVPIRSLRSKTWKYVLYRLYGEELYDLQNDPLELQNLANDPTYDSIRLRMASKLNQWILDSNDNFFQITVTDRNGNEVIPR